MTKSNKIQLIILTFLLTLSYFFSIFGFAGTASFCFASSDLATTSALEDLQRDKNFKASDYKVDEENYSLSLLTIAESGKKLYIYVYQPSSVYGDITASSINISLSEDEIDPTNYTLSLVNSTGVFYKYVVDGLAVSDAEKRIYEIVSIFRPFDANLGDQEPDLDNTINEVVYEVGKQFEFSANGNLIVSDIQTIKVTDKFVGYVRYPNGWNYLNTNRACDSHFVAFSTDKNIDKLYEAKVYFKSQYRDIREPIIDLGLEGQGWEKYGEVKTQEKQLSYDQKVSYGSGIFLENHYEWGRIQSFEDFYASVNKTDIYEMGFKDVKLENKLTENGLKNLQQKDWVLRFFESDYTYSQSNKQTMSTIVSEVTILRLKFESNGITYNLGVVDNKQTGSENPVNYIKRFVDMPWWAKIIITFLALILIALLCFLIKPILVFILRIITYPFRLLTKGH